MWTPGTGEVSSAGPRRKMCGNCMDSCVETHAVLGGRALGQWEVGGLGVEAVEQKARKLHFKARTGC